MRVYDRQFFKIIIRFFVKKKKLLGVASHTIILPIITSLYRIVVIFLFLNPFNESQMKAGILKTNDRISFFLKLIRSGINTL